MSQRALSATSRRQGETDTGREEERVERGGLVASVKDKRRRLATGNNFSTDQSDAAKPKLTLTFDIIANKRSAIENCARKEFIKCTERKI